MRYSTKQDLLEDIRAEHGGLCTLLKSVPESRYAEKGVWGDGWSVIDLIAHLAEWHGMFLRWYEVGLEGEMPEMPAPGFKWNQTPALNRAIWEENRRRSFPAVWRDFMRTYRRIVELVEGLPEEALLQPGRFGWTGKNPLVTYIGPNTASHYRFASKVLKRWLKGERRV
jgi:hypothetical protein